VGGTFAAATINGETALPFLAIDGPLAPWKSSATEITIQEDGEYQIFVLPPNKTGYTSVIVSTLIDVNGTRIARNERRTDTFKGLVSTSYTGTLEAGMKVSFILAPSASETFEAGGSFFLIRLQEKMPKILYDSAAMPQHFMGPPDITKTETIDRITAVGGSWVSDRTGYMYLGAMGGNGGGPDWRLDGKPISRYGGQSSKVWVNGYYPIVKGQMLSLGYTNTSEASYIESKFCPAMWMLPVFVTGTDLQSSTDPGKVDIDPDTKTMAVTGVPQADYDNPDPSVPFGASFVTEKTGYYYININPISGTSTARLTIQGNIVGAAYGNGSWFGVIEAGKTVERIEAFSPNSNYIFYPIKWVK
jgi:hypothetical protein